MRLLLLLLLSVGAQAATYSPSQTISLSVNALDNSKVAKAGDTMTGALNMSGADAAIVSGSSVTASAFFGNEATMKDLGTLPDGSNVYFAPLILTETAYSAGNPGAGQFGSFISAAAEGTEASPTGLLQGDIIGWHAFKGHDGSGMSGSRAAYAAWVDSDFAPGANYAIDLGLGNVPPGVGSGLFGPGRFHLVVTSSGPVVIGNLNIGQTGFDPQAQLTLSADYNGVSLLTAGDVTVGTIIRAGGGGNTWYYCSGGANDGLLSRGNSNAGTCPAGTWTAVSYESQ